MITRGLREVVKSLGDPLPFIRRRIEKEGNFRVLEIGCGLGNALAELAQTFPNGYFFGFNEHFFPCQRTAPNIKYVYGDAGIHLPFEDNSIDFAYSIYTIQFIPDKVGLLREMHRVLKKDGEFWIRLSDTLPELDGIPICTVTDGVETVSLKEFLGALHSEDILFRMSTTRLDNISLTTPSVAILRKKTDTFMLPLRDDFIVTDLSLSFPDKVGYLSTHYTTVPSFKLNSMKKVLVIAASPHGYGHLYRGEIISRYLAKVGFNVTLLSSNPEPLTQSEDIHYSTCSINMDPSPDGERMRLMLLEHIGKVRFDVVVIDHFPLGKLFLMDAFKVLHDKLHKRARFICVFRDIFSIDDFRQRTLSIDVLNQYFDQLLVFSDPNFLMLPNILTQDIRIPIDYLGYLDQDGGIPQITVFGGGGKFNLPFYRQTLKVIHQMDMDRTFRVKLFTGRALPETQRKELKQEFPSISIHDHSIELMQEISRSCITISTFGYNTLIQLLRINNYNILVPLPKNFQEQYTRAELFVHKKEKASIVILDPMYQELLEQRLEDIKGRLINLGGLPALAMKLQSL